MTSDPSPPRSPFARIARRIRDAVKPGEDAEAGHASFKTVNLALQGGGAYGAFTWGVLDGLIADERLDFEAISGTSAGAMNAVVLADGLMRDGVAGASQRLHAFWHGVSREGMRAGAAGDIVQQMLGFWEMPGFSPRAYFEHMANLMAPFRSRPMSINPLRAILEELVDFDKVRGNDALKLFVSATNVRNGKIRVFSGDGITADAVLASACLPYLFEAVEIAGEAYWDGGYMGNPALFPFFTETECADILLVQTNPLRRDEVPRTAHGIMERVAEITFNASLLREFRAIDFVNRLIDENRLDPKRYKRNRLHRIDATAALAKHASPSKLDTSWRFFEDLHEAGVIAAKDWLKAHYADIGVRATLDLRKEFG
jgi:NTE family protein